MQSEPRIVRLEARLAVLAAFRERSPSAADLGFCERSRAAASPVTLSGPYALRETEQSVFYAIAYLVGRCGERAHERAETRELRELWSALNVSASLGGPEWYESGVAYCSWRELARHAGYSDFGARVQHSMSVALERLAQCTVSRETMGVCDSSRLISYVARARGITVALEPISSLAARGGSVDGSVCQYVGLSLDERMAFSDPAGRVMHAWLRAWSSSGRRMRVITLDRLSTKIWSDRPSRSTMWRRRRRLVNLIQALSELPEWSVALSNDRCHVAHSGAGLALRGAVSSQRNKLSSGRTSCAV